MKRIVLFLVLCSGCTPSSVPIRGPNGEDEVGIYCRHSKVDCYTEAAQQCFGGGYDIQENGTETLIIKCHSGKSKAELAPAPACWTTIQGYRICNPSN